MAKKDADQVDTSAETAAATSTPDPTAPNADKAEQTPEERANETGEPVFFEGTVTKVTADGKEVMSDHLMPGETLRRDTTDRYLQSANRYTADKSAGTANDSTATDAK